MKIVKKPGKYNHFHEHRQERIYKNCGAAIGADTLLKDYHLVFLPPVDLIHDLFKHIWVCIKTSYD